MGGIAGSGDVMWVEYNWRRCSEQVALSDVGVDDKMPDEFAHHQSLLE